MGRLLSISDIHGCLKTLKKLIEIINLKDDDQIIFLGDYIDRGFYSKEVIDYLIELKNKYPQMIFLKGNHEAMFLDVINEKDNGMMFRVNGGIQTLKSYENVVEDVNDTGMIEVFDKYFIPGSHIEFLTNLKLYHETDKHIFVHAGLKPTFQLKDQKEIDLLWIREDFIEYNENDWDKTIIFGHTPNKFPILDNFKIGIDTGCVFANYLTCYDVTNNSIYMTKNIDSIYNFSVNKHVAI